MAAGSLGFIVFVGAERVCRFAERGEGIWGKVLRFAFSRKSCGERDGKRPRCS